MKEDIEDKVFRMIETIGTAVGMIFVILKSCCASILKVRRANGIIILC